MSFCYFVLFCLILTHVSPNTSFSNYQINFQFETWISNYSDKQSISYLNKSQELQLVLQSAFSSLPEKYNISIESLTQSPSKSSNEFSIIASVNFTGNSALDSSTMSDYLTKINASLWDYSSSKMPILTHLTTSSISTASNSPTHIINNTIVSTVSSIPDITINSTYYATTGYSTYSNYTSSPTTPTSELNSFTSTENNNTTGTTLLSTTFSNDNISSTSAYNTDYLTTLSNVTTTMPDVSITTLNMTPNSTISSETTKSVFIDSSTESNISNFNSVKSTESSNNLLNISSTISLSSSFKSTENTSTSQSKSLSTSFIPLTTSTRPSVGSYKNLTIRFRSKLWENEYSDMKNPKTINIVQKLTEEISKALNIGSYAVIIYSLKYGSIIVESGIQSNSLNQDTLTNQLKNIDAELISPSTSAPTTTDSGLPTYAIALIAVFTTCVIIAIAFIATALICRHRRLKGYGRHEVQFFEMDDGWKKHSTRNPSFQMD